MAKEIIFDELKKEEAILLLKAFDYKLDKEGHILRPSGSKIPSELHPNKYLTLKDSALVPAGSMDVIDANPISISKFIRERTVEKDVCSR
ncbi:MAG: hypothetical protein ABIE23_03235 [archaeon]